uniref:RNase H type-1 domain-containing protein n=1 Tax=Arion vulgaris TaxID=1028688 RepID=A0A0B6ZXP6_9EUPU
MNHLIVIFVPGHVGVQGNARPDHLTDTAVAEEGQSMNSVDINKRSKLYRCL